MITPIKRIRASRLVRTGRSISLSRDYPKQLGPGNPRPAEHAVKVIPHSDGGGAAAAVDFYGINYHGRQSTHIDALCHLWDADGMWGGRDPRQEVAPDGARWGGVQAWRDGLVTRGILLDVPRHRRRPFVTTSDPVGGEELEVILRATGLELEAGDALLVRCGREEYEAATPNWHGIDERPGLHASCLSFLRNHDVSVLGWDLMDAYPNDYGFRLGVHRAIYAFGIALVDNCRLDLLAEACAEVGRADFMLVLAPLAVQGGTGSPINPLAIL